MLVRPLYLTVPRDIVRDIISPSLAHACRTVEQSAVLGISVSRDVGIALPKSKESWRTCGSIEAMLG